MIDKGLAFSLIHHVNMILGTQKYSKRNSGTSRLGHSVFTENVLRAVGHQESDPIPLFQAELLEGICETPGFVPYFFVGVGLIPTSDGNPGWIGSHATVIVITDGHGKHGFALLCSKGVQSLR
jgi:hypothetical protein